MTGIQTVEGIGFTRPPIALRDTEDRLKELETQLYKKLMPRMGIFEQELVEARRHIAELNARLTRLERMGAGSR